MHIYLESLPGLRLSTGLLSGSCNESSISGSKVLDAGYEQDSGDDLSLDFPYAILNELAVCMLSTERELSMPLSTKLDVGEPESIVE